jgi:hypothetical protein
MADDCANAANELAVLEDQNMKDRQLVQSLAEQVRKINAQIEARQLAVQKQELEAKLQQAQEMLAAIDVCEDVLKHANDQQPDCTVVKNGASAWNHKPVLHAEEIDISSDSAIAQMMSEQDVQDVQDLQTDDHDQTAFELSKYDQQFPPVDFFLSPGEIAWGNYLQRQMQTILKQNMQLDKKKAFSIACNVHTSECKSDCLRDDCFFFHARLQQTRKDRAFNMRCLKSVLDPTLGQKLIQFYENGLKFGNATCFFKCAYCPNAEHCTFGDRCNYAHDEAEKCDAYENATYLAANGFDMEHAWEELY